jgi:hypothetical protein
MGNVDESSDSKESGNSHPAGQASLAAALKPKGACWYCNAPLDNIRRFCNKTCADDYRSEEDTFSDIKD